MSRSPVLLVTGGSRGIGAATAELAARKGYDVCLTYRTGGEEAEQVRRAVEAAGQAAFTVRADVADESSIDAMWSEAVARFGRIDVLVNNAGMLETQARLVDMGAARLRRVFAVNALGTMLCARAAVRHMSTARGGSGGVIVNVSSIAARLGAPAEYVDYAAAKAAVEALTTGLAKEVAAEGIRVNAVRPGTIDTGIHASGGEPDRVARIAARIPLGRGGTAMEIAAAILWLASPEASYATGSILEVGGGL